MPLMGTTGIQLNEASDDFVNRTFIEDIAKRMKQRNKKKTRALIDLEIDQEIAIAMTDMQLRI